jgi:anti-anti-sigma factor
MQWPPGPDRPAAGLTAQLTRPCKETAVVVIDGEVDMATAQIVDACVDRGLVLSPRVLVIDMRAVTFCSCAGLMAIERAREEGRKTHVEVQVEPSRVVRRLLDLIGVNSPVDMP